MAVPPASFIGFQFNSMTRIYFIILGVTLVLYYAYRNIIYSRVGRAFMTIRDSEVASESVGVNQAFYKSIAFILSAFYAGVAGALYSITVGWLDPENFGLMESINHLTYVIVGGMATLGGPIIGAAAFTILPELLREFKENNALISAFFLLIFIVFLPGGMVKLLSHWIGKFSGPSSNGKKESE
jgi:branched-chain amino acid transport system permease protein